MVDIGLLEKGFYRIIALSVLQPLDTTAASGQRLADSRPEMKRLGVDLLYSVVRRRRII